VELRARTASRLTATIAVLLALPSCVVGLAQPEPAAAAVRLTRPPSETRPPPLFRLSARQAERISARAEKVQAERKRRRGLAPTAYMRGPGRWQVSWFQGERELVQVRIDDRSGAILEQWTGAQVPWTMARGYEGAFGRKLNAPYIWVPLCVLFLLPFVDPRRPLRLLHLDLLVLLAFGVSHVFFNRGEISTSVPLVYPVLLYLLVRMLVAGLRPRTRAGPLVPLVPATWLVIGVVFLVGFRVALNVIDSNVIDVGYAGVIGADRIMDGDELYGPGFSKDVERGDTYGPFNYLFYVPFEQAFTWSGSWDKLPAAHGAALAFDLLTLLGLALLGRRLRPGEAGRDLGAALAFAWASYPYAAFALETNSNDSLIGLLCVAALVALTLEPARVGVSAAGRGAAVALAAAAKFVPLALAPLFASAGSRSRRSLFLFVAALFLVLGLTVLPFVPDGGLGELYDRTLGYQAGRNSPFSMWGQESSLGWLHAVVKVAAVAMALLVAFVPRRKDLRQTAALGAAVLLALQLAAPHWFYLYIVWFAPLVLVALFTSYEAAPGVPARAAPPERELVPA
jgi:glycosyl transferase family 87